VTGDAVRAPLCPGCDRPPLFALTTQYWCGNDDCRVIVWNPNDDPATFKATAQPVDLSFLAAGKDETQ
jgi:hypothetical protein